MPLTKLHFEDSEAKLLIKIIPTATSYYLLTALISTAYWVAYQINQTPNFKSVPQNLPGAIIILMAFWILFLTKLKLGTCVFNGQTGEIISKYGLIFKSINKIYFDRIDQFTFTQVSGFRHEYYQLAIISQGQRIPITPYFSTTEDNLSDLLDRIARFLPEKYQAV